MSTPIVRRAGIPSLYVEPMPSDLEQPPYKLYRAAPRGLRERLRGEVQTLLPAPEAPERAPRVPRPRDPWSIARRVLKYLVIAAVAWVLLSLVLFLISAQIETSGLPSSATDALTSGGNMLTST